MQVTTGGNISGQINYQVFPLGVGENQLQLSAQFDGEGTFNSEVIVLIPGCMDPSACNFDPAVNVNDNTCEFAEEFYNCDDSCTNDVDNDGVCDELEIVGCADPWHATTTPRRPTLMVHVHSRRNFTIAMAVARMTWTTTGSR